MYGKAITIFIIFRVRYYSQLSHVNVYTTVHKIKLCIFNKQKYLQFFLHSDLAYPRLIFNVP